MKRSKDYYQNRKLLMKLDDNKPFRPCVEDLKLWFDILNEQVFGDKLKPVKKFKVIDIKDFHAVYIFYKNSPKKKHKTTICVDCFFKSKKQFVEILAHEMVHHFQNSYGEHVGHGATFLAWRENFKLKGLNLYKV